VHATFAEIQSRLNRDPLLVLELRGVNRHWLKSRVKSKAPPRPDRRPAGQSMPIQLVDMAAFYTEPDGAAKDLPLARLKAPTLEDELPSALEEIWPPPEEDMDLPQWVNELTYRAAGLAEGLIQGGGGELPNEIHSLLMELRFALGKD